MPHRLLPFLCHRWLWLALACWLSGTGCAATLPYRYGRFHGTPEAQNTEVAIEYGKPHKVLDGLAWFTGIWSRILPLSSGVNKHELCENTRAKLVGYLEDNDLTDVMVRVNQYDPKGEWRRLRENRRVSAGWRYTAGVFGLAYYSLIPGRIFGGDQYNAYTNTLYINSDVPAVVLHEAAYAKDIHERVFPGSYAFISEVPLLSLWRHTKGVNDVLGYAQTNDDWLVERETYRVVYPQMGVRSTTISGPVMPFWDRILFSVAGAAVGHATGQVAISQRTRQRQAEASRLELDQPVEAEAMADEPDDEDHFIGHTRIGREIQPTSYESDLLKNQR